MNIPSSVAIADELAPQPGASQKVRDFILEEAKKHSPNERWRLPSIRKLASHLKVSMATVQNVYSSLGREGYITSAAKRGSFFHARSAGRSNETLHIGLAFIWEDDARHAWEGGIYAGILDASLACRSRVNFSRFNPSSEGLEDIRMAQTAGKLDSMVVLPGRILQPVTELCGELGIPVAFLLPPEPTAVSNFICPNVLQISELVADSFLKAGRERLAFVEYVVNDNRAYYTLYRTGFMQAILEHNKSLGAFRHIALGADAKLSVIKDILSAPDRPDAILCGGDNMAIDVVRAAGELGIAIPGELSVVGGSGVSFHDPMLATMTRVQQPVNEIGRELFLLAEALADEPGERRPGRYLSCGVLPGNTTSVEENRLLKQALRAG